MPIYYNIDPTSLLPTLANPEHSQSTFYHATSSITMMCIISYSHKKLPKPTACSKVILYWNKQTSTLVAV